MSAAIDWLNNLLWGNVLIWVLLFAGAYFTVRTGFIQVRRFPRFFGVMRNSTQRNGDGISAFEAFATSLASRVGTGNIAGVAVALTLGGPGSIFWMWLIAFIGMATAMVEATLAQVYKHRETGNVFRGGPAYYMQRGLGSRAMGVLFSLFTVVAFGFVFNMVQSNSLTGAISEAFGAPTVLVAAVTAAITGLVIFGGIRRIAKFAELVVPIMAVAYVGLALVIVLMNIGQVPAVLGSIVSSAFGFHQAAGGFAGWAISAAMTNGIKRGMFSNEAGMGSAPNAAATADIKHPASQGYIQALGVFIDTIVICTSTALVILLSGLLKPGMDVAGVTLTQQAMETHVGAWGSEFVAIALVFFAFTSIVANYYYGENAMLFMGLKPKWLPVFRGAVVAMVFWGALNPAMLIWNMADVAQGFMALTNLVAILLLGKVAFKVIADYERQTKAGVAEPVFDRANFPELEDQLAEGVWTTPAVEAELVEAAK